MHPEYNSELSQAKRSDVPDGTHSPQEAAPDVQLTHLYVLPQEKAVEKPIRKIGSNFLNISNSLYPIFYSIDRIAPQCILRS